jgi:hypothetical protein
MIIHRAIMINMYQMLMTSNASLLDDDPLEMELGDDDNSISAHGTFSAVNSFF